jgi:hypothetical protein
VLFLGFINLPWLINLIIGVFFEEICIIAILGLLEKNLMMMKIMKMNMYFVFYAFFKGIGFEFLFLCFLEIKILESSFLFIFCFLVNYY